MPKDLCCMVTDTGRKSRWGLGVAPSPWTSLFLLQRAWSQRLAFYVSICWYIIEAVKDARRKRRSHWAFRLHLPGRISETSLLFLQAKILQVVSCLIQISQCEYEPINQQPHFMRLQPPNCFVSAANYFWEIFLHMEKEAAVIIECTEKQKFCCEYIKGKDHIFSMFCKLP